MAYAILRVAKLKSFGNISSSAAHCFRERETLNADTKRSNSNKTVGAKSSGALMAAYKKRLETVPTVRSNAVLGIEYFVGASPEWFKQKTLLECEAYFDATTEWLKKKHGAENVLSVSRHYDETSPHLTAYIVPIDQKGKLNAAEFLDGREKLSDMQTQFASKVGEKYGLERGIEGSLAEHISIKKYYATVNSKTPELKTKVPEVEPASTAQKLAEAVGLETEHSKAIDAQKAAQEKRGKEIRARRATEQAKAKAYDLVKKNEKATCAALEKLRAESTRLRKIPLQDVLSRLGANPDLSDKNNWKTHIGRITVTGEKFYNHDLSTGGGGAIDLVMQVEEVDYKGALLRLSELFGTQAALGHVASELKPTLQRAQLAPAPFEMPAESEKNWPRVRRYLVETRRISADIVDGMHRLAVVYADRFANVVFPFLNGAGAELRGTGESPFHGIRGNRGLWKIKASEEKNVAFVESAIDAMSLAQLGFEGGVCSLSGNAGALGAMAADDYREKGWKVFAAFDNDAAGEAQARALGEAVRLRPAGKDWNDDLKQGRSLAPLPSPTEAQDQAVRRGRLR